MAPFNNPGDVEHDDELPMRWGVEVTPLCWGPMRRSSRARAWLRSVTVSGTSIAGSRLAREAPPFQHCASMAAAHGWTLDTRLGGANCPRFRGTSFRALQLGGMSSL